MTLFSERNINARGNKLLIFELYFTEDSLIYESNFSAMTASPHWLPQGGSLHAL